MAINKTFGILKGQCRILLKRVDMSLKHLLYLVTDSLPLHNLCIIYRNAFDMDWTKEVEEMLQNEANNIFGI